MQYNKVEISGVNTSTLKVLNDEEKRILLIKAKNGDLSSRDALFDCNLRLVLSIIQRFAKRSDNMDDLFQVGCIGLIKAIDNFNIELDVKFSTYAVPMIIGEVRRYLRDNNSIRVSRSVRDLAYRALQVREELTRDNLAEPTIEEISRRLEVKKESVVLALEAISEPVSLYEPVFNDSGDSVYIMDQIRDTSSDDELWIENIALKEAIKTLNEREKKIIDMAFMPVKRKVKLQVKLAFLKHRFQELKRVPLKE